MKKQFKLLGVSHSSFYYRRQALPNTDDEQIMRAIDSIYMKEPTFGTRRMRNALKDERYNTGRLYYVSRYRVSKLMRQMGIEAIYPKPRLSQPGKGHKKYPYLLRNLDIQRSDHVWCIDITYLPLSNSHVYLVAVMDWASRYVISWRLSNTMDNSFCIECLEDALSQGSAPEIFNSDQGSQFTSDTFTQKLIDKGIKISMDGKGRALDNRMIERLWRSVKYDDIYVKGYESMVELREGLQSYFDKYNHRWHQGLEDRAPYDVYISQKPSCDLAA